MTLPTMTQIVQVTLIFTLFVHLVLMAICAYRVWRGQNVIDRLIGADLVGVLALSVLIILALLTGMALFIDVALGLAALGSIVTILISKFIVDESAS